MDITKKAGLAKLTIKQWSAIKTDRAASKEVARRNSASEEQVKVQKKLGDIYAVKEYQKLSNEIRGYFYSITLPWTDKGDRIIPAQLIPQALKKKREYNVKVEKVKDKFFQEYDNWVKDAKGKLGGLFNPSDYPSLSQLKNKFQFDFAVWNIPGDKEDFRIQISQEEAEEIKKDMEARSAAALNGAVRSIYERLAEMVKHYNERVTDAKKGERNKFHDTIVTNIKDLLKVLPALNLTEDKKLKELAEEIEKKLTKVSPDDLRGDAKKREEAAKKSADLLKKMEAYTGELS